MAWIMRKLSTLQVHADSTSEIPLGWWWVVSLAVITPLVLGIQAVLNFQQNVSQNYGDYPTQFLIVAGWSVALAALLVGVLLSMTRWDPAVVHLDGDVDIDLHRSELP